MASRPCVSVCMCMSACVHQVCLWSAGAAVALRYELCRPLSTSLHSDAKLRITCDPVNTSGVTLWEHRASVLLGFSVVVFPNAEHATSRKAADRPAACSSSCSKLPLTSLSSSAAFRVQASPESSCSRQI